VGGKKPRKKKKQRCRPPAKASPEKNFGSGFQERAPKERVARRGGKVSFYKTKSRETGVGEGGREILALRGAAKKKKGFLKKEPPDGGLQTQQENVS